VERPYLTGGASDFTQKTALEKENSLEKEKTKATEVSAKRGHTGFHNKNRRYSAPMKIMINGGNDNTIRFLCLLGVHWENLTF
jgi:hypothetical protein